MSEQRPNLEDLAKKAEAEFWAKEENREMIRQSLLSDRIAAENAQAEQDSHGD